MINKIKKHAGAIAFVTLAFFGGVAINESAKNTAHHAALVNYQSQIRSCQRGNELRAEINNRINETNVTKQVVVSFLGSAEAARNASYKVSHTKADKTAAKAYGKLKQSENALRYHKVSIINCMDLIKKP